MIYQNNEQYERDKADWLYHLEIHVNEGCDLDALDVVDIIDLLKKSKWIGAVNQQNCGYHKPCTLLKDVDTTTVPN